MKKIKFRSNRPTISITDINSFERQNQIYNIRLPESYKHFLSSNSNGGVPIQRIYWDESEELELAIAHFYSINEGHYPLNEMVKNIYDDEVIPNGFLPFASDGGSGQYLISMIEEDFGSISIVYADTIEPLKLCNSFEQFINRLEAE